MRLRAGKLPVALLRRVIRYTGSADPAVVIGPRFGEDAAVIDLGDRYLILKSDPVTFTTHEIGWYAVHVNANDIAVMGARPRWFQTTLIAPPGTDDRVIRDILRDVHLAARRLRIAVTGGHTEISPAVTQPVIAGDMQGLVARNRLVTSAGVRPGDRILLTKWVAIEGTSILARERAQIVRRLLGERHQRTAARFHHRPGISVVQEALIAARSGATALHDPTEGGVAAGLYELSAASGCQIDIDLDRIPIHPFTAALCAHFEISPLGLIASGSLLAAVPDGQLNKMLRRLQTAEIPATVIGTAHSGMGVRARRAGKRVRFVWSERDEITRVLT